VINEIGGELKNGLENCVVLVLWLNYKMLQWLVQVHHKYSYSVLRVNLK